ncbi:MAG: YlxR family protein [Clostridia bacterium]|jgi:hypothetical protein|nr:YlxR family protein [Clostridia bacterium]MDD4276009.1 YlxR family protein [Clostridia bacterium]
MSEKIKKIPQRMCIVCKKMSAKSDLIRIVRDLDGNIKLDNVGKVQGRGTYICRSDDCINKMQKCKCLNRVYSTNVSSEIYQNLINEMQKIRGGVIE